MCVSFTLTDEKLLSTGSISTLKKKLLHPLALVPFLHLILLPSPHIPNKHFPPAFGLRSCYKPERQTLSFRPVCTCANYKFEVSFSLSCSVLNALWRCKQNVCVCVYKPVVPVNSFSVFCVLCRILFPFPRLSIKVVLCCVYYRTPVLMCFRLSTVSRHALTAHVRVTVVCCLFRFSVTGTQNEAGPQGHSLLWKKAN